MNIPSAFCQRCLERAIKKYIIPSLLLPEDREDCIQDFVSRKIRENGCILGTYEENCPHQSRIWKCALRSFLNFTKERYGILSHETTFTDMAGTDGENNDWEPADPAPTPEECLMRKALSEEIVKASKELNPRQQRLFRLKYLEKRSVREIANAMNLSENVASHAIRRMEAHLHKILVQRGVHSTLAGNRKPIFCHVP